MADGDGDDGGFVFGDERSTDTDAAAGHASRRTVAAAVLFVAIITLVAIYPFAASAVTGLFESGSGGAGGGGATTSPNTAVGGTVNTEPAGEPTETSATAGARTTAAAGRTPTATATARSPPADTPAATDTPTPTATATATPAATGTATPTATDTPTPVAPTIESFTVTDRSSDGTGRFDVGWNVSDADSDLVAVRVTLVADPDDGARTVAQRRFDAGGAQSSGETTFEVADGGGAAYELSIEVVDTNDNTAFELTRVVADGSPDG